MRCALLSLFAVLLPSNAGAEFAVKVDKVLMGRARDIRVEIRVSGPEMKEATDHKEPVITVATDDTGVSVLHEVKRRPPNNFAPIMRPQFEFGANRQLVSGTGDLLLDLQFKAPAPTAKSLAVIKGTIALRVGGDKTPAIVRNPKALVGKEIESPRLAAAKLKVKVLPPQDENTLSLEITGAGAPLKGMEVVNTTGEPVSNGFNGRGSNGVMVYHLPLTKPLDETMSLKFNLITDQKEVEVPIELKDIKLPPPAAPAKK